MNATILYVLLKFFIFWSTIGYTYNTISRSKTPISYDIRLFFGFYLWFSYIWLLFVHVFVLYSSKSLWLSWYDLSSSSFLLTSFRGFRMRSGSSKTVVMSSFLGDSNFHVFQLWILRPLWFLKLCSQWLHSKYCYEIVGTKGNNGAVAGLIEACPQPVTVPLLLGRPAFALP